MKSISEHVSYNEATISPTALRLGIDNTPTPAIISKMKDVATFCFEPLRLWYGKPIKVNSFYRCMDLNKKVGGSATSQHCKGEAMDISAGSKAENKKLFNWCKSNLEYDQLINEYDYTWVHISYRKGNNRNQAIAIQ